MTKPCLRILERIFEYEVLGRLPFQFARQDRPPKAAFELERTGMIEKAERVIPGPFSVTVRGYVLTHKGRLAYCESLK
jgi:hypothetical protein